MKAFDEALWDHLVEHHGADRAQVHASSPRASRRPVVVGIAATVLTAVGVAIALALSTGGSEHPATAGSGGPDAGINTAYIIKRVKAKVADEVSQDNTASRYVEYFSGEMSQDGTLTLGPKSFEDAGYTASDGVEYDQETWFNTDGSTNFIFDLVTDPAVDGKQSLSQISIEEANHTYSLDRRVITVSESTTGEIVGPTLVSSPSSVQQALQSGEVTQLGTPMFNGTRTIALSISTPHLQDILYVDPQTYQPVGQVIYNDHPIKGISKIGVQYWVPVTPANIAMAKDDSIPAGYTKVGPDDQTLGNFGSDTTTDSSTTTGSGTTTNSGAG